jgi:hypothetical protein
MTLLPEVGYCLSGPGIRRQANLCPHVAGKVRRCCFEPFDTVPPVYSLGEDPTFTSQMLGILGQQVGNSWITVGSWIWTLDY